MSEELKPCPFCGGEAEYHFDKGQTGEVYGWVGCNQCDAMSCHIDVRSMQPEETHPIDAWNTRADEARIAALEAEVARLRGVLREIAEPIAAMQDRAKQQDRQLDGGMAIYLANSASHLSGIARAALRENPDAG